MEKPMTPERAATLSLEADYLLALLDDIRSLNDAAELVTNHIADGIVALLSLISLTDQRANEFVRDGMDATNKALNQMLEIQKSLDAMLRLVNGRADVLQGEL